LPGGVGVSSLDGVQNLRDLVHMTLR
jgi:hypothetical protein